MSLPAWECGLKRIIEWIKKIFERSLPAWECGLKQNFVNISCIWRSVTPRVGVWIETRFTYE